MKHLASIFVFIAVIVFWNFWLLAGPPALSAAGVAAAVAYFIWSIVHLFNRRDDPRSRNQIDSTARVPIAKNSLCQFWNDSNQKREVPMYWGMETGTWPCARCS